MKLLHGFSRRVTAISLTAALLVSSAAGCVAVNPEPVETEVTGVKAGKYVLDRHHATVLFKVQHMGLAPYVGRFNDFDATLELDGLNPAAARVSATIATASLDVNYPDFAKQLIGKDWFDSAAFPQAVFESTEIRWADERHATVRGNLTLLGVSAPIEMQVTFIGATRHVITGTYTLGFSAVSRIRRSAFGLDKLIPVVADETEIEIHAEFQLQ
jgi:polyisoprenoid-binding protein YceI